MPERKPKSAEEIEADFKKPFYQQEVRARQGKGNNIFFYVEGETVVRRLNETLGVGGWKEKYDVVFGEQMVVCELSIKVGDEWVTRSDCGAQADSPGLSEGDKKKSAFTSALKRAALKFGIGTYLKHIPREFAEPRGKATAVRQLPPEYLPTDDPSLQRKPAPTRQAAPKPAPAVAPATAAPATAAETPPDPKFVAALYKTLTEQIGKATRASDVVAVTNAVHNASGFWKALTHPQREALSDAVSRKKAEIDAANPVPAS